MSTAYSKSISDEYSRYFEKISDFVKPFRQYSLKTHKIVYKDDSIHNPWENGVAGVPLSWNKEDNVVSVDQTDSHTLIVGPTGSKKTRLVIMPVVRILGSASESMIISDPKGEVYNRTARYLKQQSYNIFVLNLRAPMYGNCWNPLAIPYDFFCKGEIDKSYEFVNDIAQNLVQSERAQSDPFWDNSAGSFFFGLVLLLFKYCKDQGKGIECVHISNVIRLRNTLFSGSEGSINIPIWNYAKTDLIIASSLIGTVETAKDTRAGILSVFDQKMRIFSIQPNLLDMLSVNDIDFETIGTSPTAIYLIVPDEKTGYHGLVSLFIKQSYEYIIYKAQVDIQKDGLTVGKLKNRVNYILDEFSSLPTIHDFPAMITASRSRNIRFDLVIQSKHQLLQRYKDETETILTNCNNWIFFTSRELEFLEEISSICGKTSSNNPKPLLPISMLQRLDKDSGEVLVLSGRAKPCITMLPDIDKYDNNEYESVLIMHRDANKIVNLDFGIMTTQDMITRQRLLKKGMSINNLDDLIAQIDKKISELDEMEHQDQKDNDSFDTGDKNERG